ncbi:MAG TPA: recombinase family protein [Spirochaetia bacterium]|nr:recombinase family protein [Spirochaetia bacterium]HRV27209.1 recombinase family protein [Spirochaetia bacterium]
MSDSQIARVKFTPREDFDIQRVAAYARVSSGKDAMLQSLAAQISYYSELIQKHRGWEYVGVYADEAKTGTKDSRENFQRLLVDCRAKKIDMVITKSISRFARNTVTLLETVRELKTLGTDVFFEEQNIHSISADGELMLTILASYAQEESLSASENQKWRIKKNFEEGKPWDCTMLGYRAKNGVFEIVPEEAETVRLVFTLYLEGFGKQAIANRLNEMGVATRFSKGWHQDTIAKMLRNEKYAGDLLLQKTFRTDHLTKQTRSNHGELPQYLVREAHEPIIDRATFEAVQAEIERRVNETTVKKGTTTVFTGTIRCGVCGKNYRRKTSKTGFVWICATFNTKGKKFCASKQIPEETLKAVCAEALGTGSFDDDTFAASIDFITALPDNVLEFHFKDGQTTAVRWQDRSRRESWTDDKRQAAREKATRRNG